MIRVQITKVALDPYFQPVVVLREFDGPRMLHIWIGPTEAQSIAFQLEGKTPERPWSHDLLNNVLTHLSISVPRIVINDLQDNTFYAIIYLDTRHGIREVDSRPSDAIALAVRTGSPIFVAGRAMEAMVEDDSNGEGESADVEKFRKLIEDVNFGGESPAEA